MLQSAQVSNRRSEELCRKPGHHTSPLMYFCGSNQCKMTVCSVCVVEYHGDPKVHAVKNIDEIIVKKKETFRNSLSSLNNKISKLTRIRSELNNHIEVLRQKQKQFKHSLEDICRQRLHAINKNKDKFLKQFDDAYTKEQSRALEEARNLQSFIDNALVYNRGLVSSIASQPYLLDDAMEMKNIKKILDYKHKSEASCSMLDDIQSDLPFVHDFPLGFAILKEFPCFVRLKRNARKIVFGGLNKMYMRRYVTALLIAVMTIFITSLFLLNSKDPEFKFSRSDQFPCLIGNDTLSSFWSAERFCGSHMKLIRYDGISGYTRSSNFTKSIRFEMKVTLRRIGFDCVEANQPLFEVDLIPNSISLDYTFDQAHKIWTFNAYTCTQKYGICMKTNLENLSNAYLYLDSSQNILTGTFIILLSYDSNNETHIIFETDNGTIIADDIISSFNIHPVFAVYQSETVNITLSINSSEGFIDFDQLLKQTDQEYNTTGHKIISNSPEWTHTAINHTVPYIFATAQNHLIEYLNEIYGAFEITFSFPIHFEKRSKLFEISFGQVVNDILLPIVQLEASICKQEVSDTVIPPSLFCLNDKGNSAYTRILDESQIKLDFYFNFVSGEFYLIDETQEGEVNVRKYDIFIKTRGVPYIVIEQVSVVNLTVTSISKTRDNLYRFVLLILGIPNFLLDLLIQLVYEFLFSMSESVTRFINDVSNGYVVIRDIVYFLSILLFFMVKIVTTVLYLFYVILSFIPGMITSLVILSFIAGMITSLMSLLMSLLNTII